MTSPLARLAVEMIDLLPESWVIERLVHRLGVEAVEDLLREHRLPQRVPVDAEPVPPPP